MTFTAKKKFGQNFLKNEAIQKKFVSRALLLLTDYTQIDTILEIGPGRGDLTQHLVLLDKKIIALDIDEEAIEHNHTRFTEYPTFEIHQFDALQRISELSDIAGDNFLFFSNLPFNVGSRILVDMPVYYPSTPLAVVLQKEVINKLKSNASLSFFGAWLRLFYDIKFEFDISPGNFDPAPKVVSTMITARPKTLPDWLKSQQSREKAKKILKLLFTYPSKTLANNLKLLGWDAIRIQEFLSENKYAPTTRLEWTNYMTIVKSIII